MATECTFYFRGVNAIECPCGAVIPFKNEGPDIYYTCPYCDITHDITSGFVDFVNMRSVVMSSDTEYFGDCGACGMKYDLDLEDWPIICACGWMLGVDFDNFSIDDFDPKAG